MGKQYLFKVHLIVGILIHLFFEVLELHIDVPLDGRKVLYEYRLELLALQEVTAVLVVHLSQFFEFNKNI